MKTQFKLAGILLAALLSACATVPPAPSLADIVQMSKQGTPPADIVKRMADSRAVYKLSGSKLAELKSEGVPDEVLDYMYDAYVNAARAQERAFYMGYPPYDYPPYYYYPYGRYYWPYPYYRRR